MKTIAVYGSLKAGKYNHGILEDSLYLGKTKVKGTLYRISSYPALIEEGDNLYDAEIYEVSDNVYEWIAGMEHGAGYKEVIVDGHIVYYADSSLEFRCKENYAVISEY
jgi:gamma-glutamylcyclotransferase (GGCT)/AIG2-like uncharacterized protein YtfP